VEELQEILNKNKDEVEEELWKNAIKIEYEFLRYEKQQAPAFMSDEMWGRVFDEATQADRRRLFKHLWTKETKNKKKVRKQFEAAKARSEKLSLELQTTESTDGSVMAYFLNKRISDTYMKKSQEYNFDYAFRFGQPLIFDLAQEHKMNNAESSSFVRQMRQIYSDNRAQWEPFHIHLCNYDPELPGLKELAEGEQSAGYLWEVTKDCFTQRFPLERLVYLSPDAPEVASEWRHDDVYIVGGVVDKGGGDKMTLSKIKKMGIRSQRFDIDRYFTKKKTPAMTLDQVFACLLDARDTDGNWLYSYRHFPKRMVTWRPQFSCMQNVPHINTPDDLFQWQRSIVKPRTKDFPYSKLLAVNDDDNDEDDWEWA